MHMTPLRGVHSYWLFHKVQRHTSYTINSRKFPKYKIWYDSVYIYYRIVKIDFAYMKKTKLIIVTIFLKGHLFHNFFYYHTSMFSGSSLLRNCCG